MASDTILVAEDDEDLLDLALTWTTALGYRGLCAGSDQDALDLLQRSVSERIDLLAQCIAAAGLITRLSCGNGNYRIAIMVL